LALRYYGIRHEKPAIPCDEKKQQVALLFNQEYNGDLARRIAGSARLSKARSILLPLMARQCLAIGKAIPLINSACRAG
jgi:hypothetical protein